MMHYFILSTFVLHTYGLVSSVCGHWATKQTNTFTKGMIVKLLLLLFLPEMSLIHGATLRPSPINTLESSVCCMYLALFITTTSTSGEAAS